MMSVRSSNKILAKAAVVLVVFWIIALILLTRPLLNATQVEMGGDMAQRLARAVTELETLKEKNRELQWVLTNFSLEMHSGRVKEEIVERLRLTIEENIGAPVNFPSFRGHSTGPKKEYEVKRRLIHRNVKEMWYYLHHELEQLKNKGIPTNKEEFSAALTEILTSGSEHQ